MAVVKSYEPGEKPTIRGSVVTASCVLYEGPTIKDARDIDPKDFPPRPNDMTSWIRGAYKALGPSMRVMFGNMDRLDYRVNDGIGPKEGRGSHTNKYGYILRREDGSVWQKLEITIVSEDHAKRYQRRRAQGHKPKPRANWQGVSHWRPGIKEYRVWVIDAFATLTEQEFEEKFPDWVGKMPVYGIDDPEFFRDRPQPSFFENIEPVEVDHLDNSLLDSEED